MPDTIGETLAARRTLNEGHDGEPRWVQHRTPAATCHNPDSLVVAYYPGDTSTGGLPAQATLGQIADPGVTAYIWEHPDHPKRETDRHSTRLFMPTSNRGSDYGRRISILASDLAAIYGVGELQVLADIAASTEETAR